jgi:hypothetical protein
MMTIAAVYGLMVLTWLMYIQVMAALRVWNSLHWFAKAHLLPLAPPFLLLDVAVNIIIGSLLFLERPRWWTLSERLHYHAISNHGWKTYLAAWLCRNLLNPFDPDGHHCGRK